MILSSKAAFQSLKMLDMNNVIWHKTHNLWDVTHNTRGLMNIVSQFQVLSFWGLGVKVFWRFWTKGWMNESLTEVFVEQHRLHQVCEQVPRSNHSSVDLWPLVYLNFNILFIRLNSYKHHRFPLSRLYYSYWSFLRNETLHSKKV